MKNTNDVPEKITYTTGERLAEILCGALTAAALAFCVHLVSMMFSATYIVVIMMITAAVYGVLTVFSVHPDLVSKPENIRRNRRIFIAVKLLLIALLLAAVVMITFPHNVNTFDWYYF